jgi:hypothetical protein
LPGPGLRGPLDPFHRVILHRSTRDGEGQTCTAWPRSRSRHQAVTSGPRDEHQGTPARAQKPSKAFSMAGTAARVCDNRGL